METDPRTALVLEQYKSLVGDVGSIGTRYATANGFYLSVITALIGVLAYAGAGKAFDEVSYLILVLVAVFAVAICWIWRKTIVFYGHLFAGKFEVLKALEKELPVQVYALEHKAVYLERAAVPLTVNEAKVPLFMGWFFAFVAVLSLFLGYLTF
ncbi:MAG TPA: hypothetical protein VGI18_15295 [Burkholderiales bacterium]|jgi:hypothetical protein